MACLRHEWPQHRWCPYCLIDKLKREIFLLKQPTLPGMNRSSKGDEEEGKQLAKEGMERATKHAEKVDPGWRKEAYEIVYACALRNEFITADDVWRGAHRWGLPAPPDNRAWGSIYVRAIRAVIIEKTGRFTQTKRPIAHRMDIPIYHSLIFPGEGVPQ